MLAAVLNGDATALKAILQPPKRCLTTPDNEGCTTLRKAAYSGHAECLNILLAGKLEGTDFTPNLHPSVATNS